MEDRKGPRLILAPVPVEEPSAALDADSADEAGVDNVVKLSPSPLNLTVDHTDFCSHKQTVVSKYKRTVTCRVCGTLLDPIEVIFELARRNEQFVHMKREEERMRLSVAELKEELGKLKAAIRYRKRSKDGRQDP